MSISHLQRPFQNPRDTSGRNRTLPHESPLLLVSKSATGLRAHAARCGASGAVCLELLGAFHEWGMVTCSSVTYSPKFLSSSGTPRERLLSELDLRAGRLQETSPQQLSCTAIASQPGACRHLSSLEYALAGPHASLCPLPEKINPSERSTVILEQT